MTQENEHKILNLPSADKNNDSKERLKQVQKIIEKLPDKYRDVLKLREIDGFSFDEIKEMLDFEVPYIRVILSRARQMVKSELIKIYDYEKGITEPVSQVL